MSKDDLKKRGEALQAQQAATAKELADLKREIAVKVAPLREEREKISQEIMALQAKKKALSDQIVGLESLAVGPRRPGGLGFSVTAPDGAKQKVG